MKAIEIQKSKEDSLNTEGSKIQASKSHIRAGKIGGHKDYFDQKKMKIWCDHVDKKLGECPNVKKFLGEKYCKGEDLI